VSGIDVQTWRTIVLTQADCLTCGAIPEVRSNGAGDEVGRAYLRRWARRHAEENVGHHVTTETTTARSYRRDA
jgi:hypothetical protein